MSDAAKREEEILQFWREHKIFEKSLAKDAPRGEYVFYDGPPFATGLPHYGHIVASVIKDAVPRYRTMRGYHVPRRWGWDCHGLPIENIVEKELGFKHKKDIIALGIAKFNELCRSKVLTYADEWKRIMPRIGRWADMDNPYFTMSREFMESVWWAFKQLYDNGLVYEDYRSMHICPRCETTLSQQEVSEGYKDVKDIAVTVKFKMRDAERNGYPTGTSFLAWTTTPWTLPGNVALAVGEKIIYVLAQKGEEYFILGRDKVSEGMSVEKEVGGATLAGLEYEPPFDYYISDKNLKNRENGWKVYAADFVKAEEGTGIAHEAPAFGADDWELLKKQNLPFVQHVNMDGTFMPEVTGFAGIEVKPNSDDDKVRLGADIAVLKYLQEHGLLFSKENITHPYPHCWRCDTPLLNYATSSWFVHITKVKDELLKNAEAIQWSPEHIKEGRFGKWLEGARDWSISRQRFWASVIPLWRCEECKKEKVFGSAAELEEASGKKIDDLHKHIVDEITLVCECGGTMRRVPDVLDTWFDSGSMPYGQGHYPFENKEQFDKIFPAQFIAEGIDQTRAWFYYLHVLAGALFHKNAFQNVIVNGIVLAEDGKKMSKKLNNYPDPMEVVGKYGADALRLYLLSSPVVQAENLAFSEHGVEDVAKKNISRLRNVLEFYMLYANDTPRSQKSEHVLDRWILARLGQLVSDTTEGFESYQLNAAARPLAEFIDDLSTWYIRRSRDRFKQEDKDALSTLRFVLCTVAHVTAPLMPFFAEHLFLTVREGTDEESVHLAAWPTAGPVDGELLAQMQHVRDVASRVLQLREATKIKVRQPLASVTIDKKFEKDLESVLKDEIHVKKIIHDPSQATPKLDLAITPELREEGIVRELVRRVQEWRKESGLTIADRPAYELQVSAEEKDAAQKNKEKIMAATGLSDLTITDA